MELVLAVADDGKAAEELVHLLARKQEFLAHRQDLGVDEYLVGDFDFYGLVEEIERIGT